jgi:hypothetical protein
LLIRCGLSAIAQKCVDLENTNESNLKFWQQADEILQLLNQETLRIAKK